MSDTLRVDRLVFGGGGNRINAYLGALDGLGQASVNTCYHFIGASAGSIVAAFAALRVPIVEMCAKAREHPFDIPYWWYVRGMWRFLTGQNGLVPIEDLRTILADNMERVSPGASNLTFGDLFYKYWTTLEIQAMDAHTCKRVVFNRLVTPDELILDAMVASCAIPTVFAPFPWNPLSTSIYYHEEKQDEKEDASGSSDASNSSTLWLCDGAISIPAPWGSLEHHHADGTKTHPFAPVVDVEESHRQGKSVPMRKPFTLGFFLDQDVVSQSTLKSKHSKDQLPYLTQPFSWSHAILDGCMHSCMPEVPSLENFCGLSNQLGTKSEMKVETKSNSNANSPASSAIPASPATSTSWYQELYKPFMSMSIGHFSSFHWKDWIPGFVAQPYVALRHAEYRIAPEKIGVRLLLPVDEAVHGSVFHAMWPSEQEKELLFQSSKQVVVHWKESQMEQAESPRESKPVPKSKNRSSK